MQVNLERNISSTVYSAYAIYNNFSLSDSSTNYVLNCTYFNGTGLLIYLFFFYFKFK